MSSWTAETFGKLPLAQQHEIIAHHDENVREWFVRCPKCGFKTIGTLRKLRGAPCGACGYGKAEQPAD